MASPSRTAMLLAALSLCLFAFTVSAIVRPLAEGSEHSDPLPAGGAKLHIVYLGKGKYGGARAPTLAHHQAVVQTVLPSEFNNDFEFVYNYVNTFSGFAAMLTDEQAASIRRHPDVVSTFASGIKHLRTTYTWAGYLGLSSGPAWGLSNGGASVIVGLLDSGIWPESESFNDQFVSGIPSRWKGGCTNTRDFPSSLCNKKLIGAKFYSKGLIASGSGLTSDDFDSPRDAEGHGTHTSSTAAGAQVANASFLGIGQGTATGGAFKAHVAMYKVCWLTGCADADILAAFDDAAADGVDVLSVSLGAPGEQDFTQDSIAIGSFHAVANGILVAASAGNDGLDGLASISNSAPWLLTVAASSVNRDFPADIVLGDGTVLAGTAINSFTLSKDTYPVVTAKSGVCTDIPTSKLKGAIAVCDFTSGGEDSFVGKAGGVGVVLNSDLLADVGFAFTIAASAVNGSQHDTILSYINSTSNPTVTIKKSQTVFNDQPAPLAAVFSSRGPSVLNSDVLKPDLTAPGLDILAAWSPVAPITASPTDTRKVDFNIISGTSMSCPHVAGSAALVKAYNPTWSPAAIKSALMTTATPLDPSLALNTDQGWAYGSGQINPNAALTPGLVYDNTISDNLLYLCSFYSSDSSKVALVVGENVTCPSSAPSEGDLNYPSISISSLNGTVSVTRTLTNVASRGSTYSLTGAQALPFFSITVEPSTLVFNKSGDTQQYTVTFAPLKTVEPTYVGNGFLTWGDGVHSVRTPFLVYNVAQFTEDE